MCDKVKGMKGRGMWHVWDLRNANSILVAKPEGKSSLGKRGNGWKGNDKMDHKQWMGRHGLDSCASGYGKAAAVVNAVMNLLIHEVQRI